MEAGSAGGVEDKASMAAEEEELTRWAVASGEVSSADTGSSLVEDATDESSGEEEDVAAGSMPTRGRGRVPRRAGSGEPVRPDRAARPQLNLEGSGRHTRATAAKRLTKAAEKKKTTAPSSSGRTQTPPPPSPPPAGVDSDDDVELPFDLGPLSPERKRKLVEEEETDDE